MSLPVKSATQPSGVVNRRMHLNLGILAHIEPVRGVGRYADQIALLAQHGIHFTVDMQVKQAAAFDKKAHFKIGMDVFRQKFLPERGFVGMIRI